MHPDNFTQFRLLAYYLTARANLLAANPILTPHKPEYTSGSFP